MTLARLCLEAELAHLRPIEFDYDRGPGVVATVGKGAWRCEARGRNGTEALRKLLRRMKVIR